MNLAILSKKFFYISKCHTLQNVKFEMSEHSNTTEHSPKGSNTYYTLEDRIIKVWMSSTVPTKWTAELVLYYRNRNNTCLKWKKFRLTISSWHGNQLLSIFLYNNWKMHFMFSSAKPSFCSNFQTYKKKSFEKNINPFFFQLKNWPVHFPLDLH